MAARSTSFRTSSSPRNESTSIQMLPSSSRDGWVDDSNEGFVEMVEEEEEEEDDDDVPLLFIDSTSWERNGKWWETKKIVYKGHATDISHIFNHRHSNLLSGDIFSTSLP